MYLLYYTVFTLSFRSALSNEENAAEHLRESLTNNAKELEVVKRELEDKIRTLAENESLVHSLNESLTENQGQVEELQRVNKTLMENQSVIGKDASFCLFSPFSLILVLLLLLTNISITPKFIFLVA